MRAGGSSRVEAVKEAAAAIALTVNASGGAVAKTTVLLTPEEVDAAAARSVAYAAPGA